MKFTLNSSELSKALALCGEVIPSNPVLNILEDFLFDIDGNSLTIRATDLEVTASVQMDVRSSKDGQVCIPARILMDTLKALPPQPITIEIEPTNGITITASSGSYRMAGEDGADFPKFGDLEVEVSVDIDATSLAHLCGVSKFASTDMARSALCGVYFVADGVNDTLDAIATDEHQLVKRRAMCDNVYGEGRFIIPAKSLNLWKPSGGDVSVVFGKKRVAVSWGNVTVTSFLTDARYPDYNSALPRNAHINVTVNKADLVGACKRVGIFANKTTNQIICNFENDTLTVSARDLDFNNEAHEELSCTTDGENIRIGFNSRFMLAAIQSIPTEQIRFEMTSPKSAVLINGMYSDTCEDYNLVMPVMTRKYPYNLITNDPL